MSSTGGDDDDVALFWRPFHSCRMLEFWWTLNWVNKCLRGNSCPHHTQHFYSTAMRERKISKLKWNRWWCWWWRGTNRKIRNICETWKVPPFLLLLLLLLLAPLLWWINIHMRFICYQLELQQQLSSLSFEFSFSKGAFTTIHHFTQSFSSLFHFTKFFLFHFSFWYERRQKFSSLKS